MELNPRTKKIIIILIFIILVIILAYLMYLLFFQVTPEAVVINEQVQINGLPTIGNDENGQLIGNENTTNSESLTNQEKTDKQKQPEAIVETIDATSGQKVFGLTRNNTGQLQYYDQNNGQFYKYFSGQKVLMSDKIFHNVEQIAWSHNGQRAVLEYPDGANIVYDFIRQKQITLPPEMTGFSFDSTGEKIAAKVITDFPDNNWIVTANYDGSGIFFVEHLGDKSRDVRMNWSPAGEIVGTYREGKDFERQEVFPLSKSGNNLKSLVVEGRNFEYQWAPQGDYILYSVYSSKSEQKPILYLANMAGDQTGMYKVNLGLNTWSDKCVFTSDSTKVYCAVPTSLPKLAGIFRELTNNVSDNFYEIDLNSGFKTLLNTAANGSIRATNMSISTDGDILYFVDSSSGELKQIKLR